MPDEKAERATFRPSRTVTLTHTGAPDARALSHPDPVEPWKTNRSPSLAKPIGSTNGPPSVIRPTWATITSSSSASSSHRSVLARSGFRVGVRLRGMASPSSTT